jgi:hypothetical protein
MTSSAEWLILLLAIVINAAVVIAEVNCTASHDTGDIEFPFFKCPNNTHCVISDIGAYAGIKSNGGLFSLMPVGCCPDHLTEHCLINGTAYSNLVGCCPASTVCCVNRLDSDNYLVGCAEKTTQCCGARICERGYRCCTSRLGSSCCPESTMCESSDFALKSAISPQLESSMHRSFFNISVQQMCIPVDYNYEGYGNFTDASYPYILEKYNVTSPTRNFTSYFVIGIEETPNVTECGNQMCYNDDECIYRYRNISKTRIYRNMTNPLCTSAKVMGNNTFDTDCFRIDTEIETERFAAGCCAPDKTPCGSHSYTFSPYPINAHSSPFLYDRILGCASANETCCHPFICPPEAKCCTARRQVYGYDYNITKLREDIGNTSFATNNGGHNFCCPAEAVCCEYIPEHAIKHLTNMRPKSVPFCGTDDTCTRNFFSNGRLLYPQRAVRETIPWDNDPFLEALAFRQSLGVVGNTNPYITNPQDLANTCYFDIMNNGTLYYFDISCKVLNVGDAASMAAVFAPNVAPFVQLKTEEELGGVIPCPSPTPEVWCSNGV